jgi:NitT/TauT family transport system substrate-binding protein
VRVLSLIIVVSLFICVSCGEEEQDQVSQVPPVDVVEDPPIEIDIYAEAPLLQVGFVKQDHHAAVFVSALRCEQMKEMGSVYLEPLGETFYALIADNEKVAEIELIQSQGAINVPNNMQAGLFEVAFGGVVPFAASNDQGSGIVIISPLHSRGDMLVVSFDNEAATDWETFVEWVSTSEEPILVGYKSPKAVALIIFESVLTEAGIPYSFDGNPVEGSKILLFNANGEPNLNPALKNGTIDAYISNNPACALAEHNEIGVCIAELSDLPPGDFANHPCCAIAATETVMLVKPAEVAALLRLFKAATEYINLYPEDAAAAAAEWIGNPVEVEIISMATSGYSMELTQDWLDNMDAILNKMRDLGAFTGPLAEENHEANAAALYDFSLLP